MMICKLPATRTSEFICLTKQYCAKMPINTRQQLPATPVAYHLILALHQAHGKHYS